VIPSTLAPPSVKFIASSSGLGFLSAFLLVLRGRRLPRTSGKGPSATGDGPRQEAGKTADRAALLEPRAVAEVKLESGPRLRDGGRVGEAVIADVVTENVASLERSQHAATESLRAMDAFEAAHAGQPLAGSGPSAR
jgi:hypothetical protein